MKSKSIELLAFDKNHQLQYEGKCKLRIDRLSSLLLVEPENEEFKMISAMFKWDFVMDKNILFVFAEHQLSDFALVFDEEKRCEKVFNFICKDNAKIKVPKEMLFQRFLVHICELIALENVETSKLNKLTLKWIEKHENKEKEELIKFLKAKNIFDNIYTTKMINMSKSASEYSASLSNCYCDDVDINDKNNDRTNYHRRKRRFSQIGSIRNNDDISDPQEKHKSSLIFPKYIHQDRFKFVNVKSGNGILLRLLIFVTCEKMQCYEYAWSCKRNVYFCKGCQPVRRTYATTAIYDKDENGVDCIKLEDKKHVCSPIPYFPENYIQHKICKKPDYVLLENCNVFFGKVLIIFNENDKNQCWEFRVEKQVKQCFRCRQCGTPARLWHVDTEDEYVLFKYPNHRCKFVPYDPKKFYRFQNFILSPDFEIKRIYRNGEKKERLIIFDRNDRNFCYVYSFISNIFLCIGCCRKGLRISAKILQNSDGEDYVLLSTKSHVCALRSYAALSKTEIILRSPQFELMENTENGVKKLFVFDSNDRNLCYTFSEKGGKNRYQCCSCNNISSNLYHTKSIKQMAIIQATLCTDENGENIVRLNDSSHICKPTKYEPEKYAKKEIQKCYDYFFFHPKNKPNSIYIAFYHPEDKRLCFKLNYNNAYCYFACNTCCKKKKSIITRQKIDENEKEYYNHDFKKHICQPVKVSSICAPKYVILKRNELSFKNRKTKFQDIDANKIIKSSNFVLYPNSKYVQDAILFVFHSEDQSNGYKYFYYNSTKKYACASAQTVRCYATANLHIQENGEKYIILGKTEHQCQPIKHEKEYEFKEKIISASNFIFSPNAKLAKIFVFTTQDRNECYEFNFNKTRNYYQCVGCSAKKKHVTARLNKNENGQEYLRMSKQGHICQPKKYNPPKIISHEMFELCQNFKGESNKRLLIFTSAEKKFVHEFASCSKYSYRCMSCKKSMNKNFNVKVCEDENGQKYVECDEREHVCEPREYDPKRYIPVELNLISSERFVLHDGKNGEKNKYLIIFDSEKQNLAYQYYWRKTGYYYCNGCCALKLNVSAKLVENANGSKSVKLGENKHICKPQKYDPKKY